MPLSPFKPKEKMPDFMPIDFKKLTDDSVNYDKNYYTRSDTDFAARHPGMLSAEKMYESKILNDQRGDTELNPALQHEAMRGGLEGAYSAFGPDATLGSGTAAEAATARNLGLSVMGFQDRNRQNALSSLNEGESLFQRRSIGVSGKDIAQSYIANLSGQNNWNQANYADQIQQEMFNYRIQAENAAASASAGAAKSAAGMQAGGAIAGAAVTGLIAL